MSIVVGNLEGFSPLIISTLMVYGLCILQQPQVLENLLSEISILFQLFLIHCYAISHLLVVVSNIKTEWLLYNV